MSARQRLSGAYADFFLCGICSKLVTRPQVHDGGYGQAFCQRAFCEVCVGSRAENPVFQRSGKHGGYETICPTPGCGINFRPPYFRKLGVIEKICYNNLIITCFSCDKRFEVFNFLAHKSNCRGRDAVSTLAPVQYGNINRLEPTTANQTIIKKIINNERLMLISNNQTRWKINELGAMVDMYFRTLGSDFHHVMPTGLSVNEALARIATLKDLDKDSIDVVYVSHVSMRQFKTVRDFLNLMPDCADFNLVGRSKFFADPAIDLRFQIMASHPKRLASRDVDEQAIGPEP